MNRQTNTKAIYALITTLAITAILHLTIQFKFLQGWLALYFILCVPTQVAFSKILSCENGYFSQRKQPFKGIDVTLICLIIGALVTAFCFFIVGGTLPPGPVLINYSIVVVVSTFWFAIIWRCWPISLFFKSPKSQFISIITIPLLIGFLLFRTLFNFDALKGTALYQIGISPEGLFSSWYVVAFMVTTVSIIFSLVLFDFKLFQRWEKSGAIWSLFTSFFILLVSSIIYGSAIFLLEIDPVIYLVNGPISYIFGMFIPLNLYSGKLFNNKPQPKRGLYLIIVSLASGMILNIIYRSFSQLQVDVIGNSPYGIELWMANAMLAFSFPILVAITDHFHFWPLNKLLKKSS